MSSCTQPPTSPCPFVSSCIPWVPRMRDTAVTSRGSETDSQSSRLPSFASVAEGRSFRNANQLVITGSPNHPSLRRLPSASQVPFGGGSPDASTPHATSASQPALRSSRKGGVEERRISCSTFALSMDGTDRMMQSRLDVGRQKIPLSHLHTGVFTPAVPLCRQQAPTWKRIRQLERVLSDH